MKKNPKQIVAIFALVLIVILIIAFVISAFTAGPGEAGNRFMVLLYCIVAIPILAWLLLFCINKMQKRPTMEEFFPEQEKNTEEDN
ncbi:MAG: DUF2207 domain-containing protein [Lachnospiraceae bacterium]|nr:DUF2207 domain-containing protein [Lachnospiraceae bacterium]